RAGSPRREPRRGAEQLGPARYLWHRAPAAFRVRVWQITSRGGDPRIGRPLPQGARVAYAPRVAYPLRSAQARSGRNASGALRRQLAVDLHRLARRPQGPFPTAPRARGGGEGGEGRG